MVQCSSRRLRSAAPRLVLLLAVMTLAATIVAAGARAADPPAAPAAPAAGSRSDIAVPARTIVRVTNDQRSSAHPMLGLQDRLVVQLDGDPVLEPQKWVLLLDGLPMRGLPVDSPDGLHQLSFQLRLSDNPETRKAWRTLLGAPDAWSRQVAVSLARIEGTDPADGSARLSAPVTAANNVVPTFRLNIIGTVWLAVGVFVLGLFIWVVVDRARRTSVLRDNVLPQLPPLERPYSLGRVQMAFWFVLILSSFVFLWLLLWDYNTVTAQALMLMGISGATGLAALVANNSNADAVNKAKADLVAAKFLTAADIQTVRAELKKTHESLADNSIPDARRQELVAERDTLQARVATFDQITGDWAHKNFWTDMINDDSGPALHRIQVIAWTVVLGGVFLIDVYRTLTMPEFSATLLALMAVSGGTYVGFKIPEQT